MAIPAYKSAGAGARTLLCLHGIGGNQDAFDRQLGALPCGWRGVAWDMPGYGASAAEPEMTFESLAAAALRVLDDLGAETAVVFGHSMGGMVAQEIAARYPARLAGLVLFATTPAFGGRDDSFKKQFLADRLTPLDEGKTPADIAPGLVGGMFSDATPEDVRAAAAASMAAVPAEAYRRALTCIVTFDRRADLENIGCPTLVLAAANDRLSPPKTMARMAEKIPGAAYHCLTGAGHLATFEDPPQFNRVLNDFLKTTG